jgi:hypothetical protein
MDLKKIEKLQNINSENNYIKEFHVNEVDIILEKEKTKNKSEIWNKLDRTIKLQLLHSFAEKYGKIHSYSVKDVKALKIFFIDCLDKGRLSKVKEVNYNKETKSIDSIPELFLNPLTKNFTLKNLDENRVSTLKSLTPKKLISNIISSDI